MLITLLATVAIAAVVLYCFNKLIPLPSPYREVLNAIVGLMVFLIILDALSGRHMVTGWLR